MYKSISHYYGDIVRFIFIAIGIIVLLGMPGVTQTLRIPGAIALLVVVILGFAAGVTNPVQPAPMILNIFVSLFGLIMFGYVSWYMRFEHVEGFLLILNQIITVLFLIALYMSIKTYRGYKLTGRTLYEKIDYKT